MLDITAISKTFHPGTPNARQALRQMLRQACGFRNLWRLPDSSVTARRSARASPLRTAR